MKKLIDFFQNKPVQKVLDVGTGPGHFIKILKDVFPNAQISGVDPDGEALEVAAREYPEVNFREMTGERLEFEDNLFDVAGISMALHHLSDIQRTLKEMKRVVKPGGWIVVNELFSDDLNPAQEVHKAMHHFRSRIDRQNGIVHHDSFTKKVIREEVEKAGLELHLQFEYKSPEKQVLPADIAERKEKLWAAIESIKDRLEYEEWKKEIPALETALDRHGFEMATRLVLIGKVQK